jgi:hypothetical protein
MKASTRSLIEKALVGMVVFIIIFAGYHGVARVTASHPALLLAVITTIGHLISHQTIGPLLKLILK